MAKKSLPWLRLYTEFATDYKVQMMSETMQRRLIMLFCFQREGTLNLMSDDEISYRLGVSKNEWKKTRLRFREAGFINDDDAIKNGDDFLTNFSNRQRDSDDSAKRKRNQRLRAVCPNDVTGHSCDMSQKCPTLDIDTDTDTEEDKKKEKKEKKISAIASVDSASPHRPFLPVQEIFEFWKKTMGHEKAKLDSKRKRLISESLKLGYSQEDIFEAIAGCSKSSFHMGGNDDKKFYDDISLICRDAQHIDMFIKISKKPECVEIEIEDPF